MTTNLKDLLAKASITQKLIKRSIEWKIVNEETGKAETQTAEIFIVERVSFASSDRIYFGSRDQSDQSMMARNIVERIRLGENGEEKFTLEQAQSLRSELGWALTSEITKLDKELNPPIEDEEAKDSSQTTNSGTNSSSMESVAGQ